jgi:transposase
MKGKDQGAKFEMRLKMVRWAQETGVRDAARAFGCSRNTVRLWLRRYEAAGAAALVEESRAPRRITHKASLAVEREVVRCRKQAPFMGPRRLKYWFGLGVAHTTIGRILRSRELTAKQRRKHHTKQDLRAVKAQYRSLRRLQMDVKYLWDMPEYWPWLSAFGLPRYQYTIRDVKSGALFLSFSYRYCAFTARRSCLVSDVGVCLTV